MTTAPRPQRKMVDIDVEETSLVDHPAHGVEGWVTLKAAGPARAATHMHLVDNTYLNAQEQESAKHLYGTDKLKTGESVPVHAGASIKKDTCGCLYLDTPHAVQKSTADDEKVNEAYRQSIRSSNRNWYLTPEEIDALTGEAQGK